MWQRVPLVLLAACLAAHTLGAQDWNDARARALVEQATRRRAAQLADSSLADYSASAHGYLTFLAQLGEGFLLPPKVVKADELAMDIYWKAPNFSKQWIAGRRDTLLLPTDIQYHRDHLGIIQNNFPDIIRLGDGDEVQDVPHPLSAPGLAAYDFRIGDSLRFEIPGRTIDVYEVKVRPRNDRVPAAVGALYLAKDDAQVVRMAFSFTRPALKDRQLEDVSIILENSLIEGRYWLPARQEIEIRRTGSWMDFPVLGIIRGRWEIRDYKVNAGGTVALSPGPEIVLAPAARRAAHRWPDRGILDALPANVMLATGDDVRQVQEEARRLVRAQALARARATLPSARTFSDIIQFNRVEGLAVGGGVRRRVGAGFDAGVLGRYGVADNRLKGTLSAGWERANHFAVRARVFDDFRDAGDEQETSRARNSIGAQEFAADLSQPFGVRGVSLSVGGRAGQAWRWAMEARREGQRALEVHASPSQRRFAPTLASDAGIFTGVASRFDRVNAPWFAGTLLQIRSELRLGVFTPSKPASSLGATRLRRVSGTAELHKPAGRSTIVGRLSLAGVGGSDGIPRQEAIFSGGPMSAPGYRFHQFRGTGVAMSRVELRSPIPSVSIPLGRWGRIPGTMTVAPFAGVTAVRGQAPNQGRDGAYPFVGVGLLSFFDILRLDVARGLRHGGWRLGVDIGRDFWPIL